LLFALFVLIVSFTEDRCGSHGKKDVRIV